MSVAQLPKKEIIEKHKLLSSLSIEEASSIKYEGLATELSVEDFIVNYIRHGKAYVSKKYGDEYLDSIYQTSDYTYFLHRTFYPLSILKVQTIDLSAINLNALDGNVIRQQFIDEVIPQEDKNRVAKKRKFGSTDVVHADFNYNYNKHTHMLEVNYWWKVRCGMFFTLNKKYKWQYSLIDKAFKI